MSHSWNAKPNRSVAHVITCSKCSVTVWRIFDGTRGANFYEFPGTERVRGLAPRCTGQAKEAEIKISKDLNSDDELTPKSHELFMELAEDAGNWSGVVPTDGNIQMTNSQRGNLTHLKKLGLITTDEMDGSAWVYFTEAGKSYAALNGIDLSWIER